MNKIRLYIEDQEIELQEDVQVAITRQFEELSNPTIICNDYTKTVKIPMTAKNNIIFGNIYNPDMITADIPENLLLNMMNGVELWQSDNLMHTNKEYPVYYDHPQILLPKTLYNAYWPTGLPDDYHLISYRVYRGYTEQIYETYIDSTTELGRHSFTFTLTNSMTGVGEREITFDFSGTTTSQTFFGAYVTIDLEDFEDGTYQMSFDTVVFDTTNNQAVIKNMVLTKGDTVVYGNDIANHIGIYFDPYRKLNFRLEWNADLLMQGYAKMLSTTKENGKGYYEVTLNGELGKVLQEMQKITFDPAMSGESDGKYYIDGSQYVDVEMNKELIYSAWTHAQSAIDIEDPNLKFYDVINFAPNNSFNENFDYKSYEYMSGGIAHQQTFVDTLEGSGFKTVTHIDAETVIPDGMTPRGIGEYRSYLQQPFIYFNKLFKIFRKKSEELTGYKFYLDSSWFNQNNPLWWRSVVLLNNLGNNQVTSYANRYGPGATTNFITYYDGTKPYKYRFSGHSDYLTFGVTDEELPILQPNGQYFNVDNKTYFDGILNFSFTMTVYCNLAEQQTIKIRNNFVFVIDFYAYDGNRETQVGRVCVKDIFSTYTPSHVGYDMVILNTTAYIVPSGPYNLTLVQANVTLNLASVIASDNLRFYFKVNGWHAERAEASPFVKIVDDEPSSVQLGDIRIIYETIDGTFNTKPLVGRSYSRVTLNDFWNNEYKIYDIILNYCKMHRIFIKVDELNKKIRFIPSHKYFENYEILDWTDKVCTDKEFKVKPVSWDNKYISFNYEDNETELGKKYKSDYGVNWGEKKITTIYNFNTETKELFSGITPSLIYTPNVLSWTDLYSLFVAYRLPKEIYVNMSDEENKFVDQFGAFYIMRSLINFDTSNGLRNVIITDDTLLQIRNNAFYYSQYVNKIDVTKYPRLDIIYGSNMCVFSKPMENYTYDSSAYNNGVDIYNKIWKKYLTERYDRNNKVVTCYIYMTPNEYINFDFNKFVKIEDQLYIVNKIYDYDAVTNQKVKVDLVTIQDITGYTTR